MDTIDLNLYRKLALQTLRIHYKRNPTAKDVEVISELSVLTGIPVIAMIYYIAELRGWNDGLRKSLKVNLEAIGDMIVVGIID